MPKIEWLSEQSKKDEWARAKSALAPNGVLHPNGTKLRRKDSGLSHSFIVIDGKILAMAGQGVYLGQGAEGRVKLSEDEEGGIYALKIGNALLAEESDIATDLGKAIPHGSRPTPEGRKYYLPYFYLGKPLKPYLFENKLDHDQFYNVIIKVFLAFHDLHQGKLSKTNTKYRHYDPHFGNITLNEETGDIHLIDLGFAQYQNKINYPRLARYLRRGTFFGDFSDFVRGKNISFEFAEATNFTDRCPFHLAQVYGSKFGELLENLGSDHESAQFPYTDRTTHPFLRAAKQLTLLRFKLDTFDLYHQRFSDSDLEEILRLNRMSGKIQSIYESIAQLSNLVEHLDIDPEESSNIKTSLLSLETTYKNFLIACAQYNEEKIHQYSGEFETLFQSLCIHNIMTENEAVSKPILECIKENKPCDKIVSLSEILDALPNKTNSV